MVGQVAEDNPGFADREENCGYDLDKSRWARHLIYF